MHPGGANVFYASGIAGKDTTDTFFGLHRHEVLLRPQYARLQIGVIAGEEEVIKAPVPGALSKVPYGEPTWLSDGFRSPYYTDNHRKFHKAFRTFMQEVVQPEAVRCEENGKRLSQEIVVKLSEINFLAMRLGPGKHLSGRKLMGGIVKPEEFDYFHEVSIPTETTKLKLTRLHKLIVNGEIARFGTRAFVDGLLNGGVIGLPPVLNYGSPELQAKVVPDVSLSVFSYESL